VHVEVSGEGAQREVGPGDPGLRLDDHEGPLGHVDREAPFRLFALEPLPRDPAGLEGLGGALLEAPHHLDKAVQLEQRLAGLVLELAPEGQGLLRQPNVLGLGVGEPEDPRASVARATVVADPKLLVHDRLVAAPP
jgi:hypothetical protein